MWTASSLPSVSYKQHQPLLLPPSTPYTFSCLAPTSISGSAECQCLGRRTRYRTWIGTIVQCSIGTPNLAPAFCPLTRHSRRLLSEMDDHDCRDSHGSCYFTSSGRRRLLFMSLISFLHPQLSLAETLDAAKLLTMRNSLRAVLSKAKAAGMLRMAFHDAGTYDLKDHTGGMNGSIIYELDRPENAGLNKSLKILAKAKEEVNKIHQVSWADLIAVAGSEAVFLCGGPSIPVKIGRVDDFSLLNSLPCRKPDPMGKLPQETLDSSGLKSCFQRIGLSTQELVALSGAHTLGSKGFGNPNVFDNAYYKILLDKPWTSGSMSNMIGLPSDHALVEDDECLRWIKVYAGDQLKFFEDFANAYVKLVNSGAVWGSGEI